MHIHGDKQHQNPRIYDLTMYRCLSHLLWHHYSTLCPKWSGTVKLISIVLLYVTTINYAFNHSNLHLLQYANFIKVHRTVYKINVFKTWHLKCDFSNIAHASSLLPKSRSVPFPNTLRYNRKMFHLIELIRRWSFCLAILTITLHGGCGHRNHRTWIWSTTKCGVCSKNACTVPRFETLTIWSSDYRRVESLRPENHWPSSASVACSTTWVY